MEFIKEESDAETHRETEEQREPMQEKEESRVNDEEEKHLIQEADGFTSGEKSCSGSEMKKKVSQKPVIHSSAPRVGRVSHIKDTSTNTSRSTPESSPSAALTVRRASPVKDT